MEWGHHNTSNYIKELHQESWDSLILKNIFDAKILNCAHVVYINKTQSYYRLNLRVWLIPNISIYYLAIVLL